MPYCPVCFSDTMSLSPHGVIHLTINGKSKQSRQFLYNITKETKEEIAQNLEAKIEEFMVWFSSFQTKEPIRNYQLFSADYRCENGCKTNKVNRFSIIGELISGNKVEEIIHRLAKKYSIDVKLDVTE